MGKLSFLCRYFYISLYVYLDHKREILIKLNQGKADF